MPECYGYFDDWDYFCWDFCPYSTSCRRKTFNLKPKCYGCFDDWDGYCWFDCPYSRECELATWGENLI